MQWVWWLILAAGCSEWMVTLTNRVHGIRIRESGLKHVRHLLELGVLVVPWTIFVALLLHSTDWLSTFPSAPTSESWWATNLTGGRAWITFFGVTGFAGLVFSSWRFHFCRVPPQQVLSHSTTIDIRERVGHPIVVPGPYFWMTKFPWNEIHTVEMAEKHFYLPRLPREWSGLSIVHLTDFHLIGTVDRDYFESVCELVQAMQPDLFVFTGDLLDDPQLSDWLPTTLGRLNAPLGRYFILGNHDWNLEVPPIRETMNRLGWIDVAGRTESIDHRGKPLLIGGTERPWMGSHPEFSSAHADAFRLLLSHTPDNLGWARRQHVDLMLAGHNHGGQVVLPLIGPVYSPSLHGVRYAGGVYDASPTLLHVSRGLSGRYPLRWRCRPEVTKLVLYPQ